MIGSGWADFFSVIVNRKNYKSLFKGLLDNSFLEVSTPFEDNSKSDSRNRAKTEKYIVEIRSTIALRLLWLSQRERIVFEG